MEGNITFRFILAFVAITAHYTLFTSARTTYLRQNAGILFQNTEYTLDLTEEYINILLAQPYVVESPAQSTFTCELVFNATVQHKTYTASDHFRARQPRNTTRDGTQYRPHDFSIIQEHIARQVAKNLDKLYQTRLAEAQRLYDNLMQLLANPLPEKLARIKRSQLKTFQGPGPGGWLNIATENQIGSISDHIYEIDKVVQQMSDMDSYRSELTSKLARQQLVIMETINNQTQAFRGMFQRFSEQFHQLNLYLTVQQEHELRDLLFLSRIFSAYFAKVTEIQALDQFHQHYETFSRQIREIKLHKLPPDFLAQPDVEHIHKQIHSYVAWHYPQLQQFIESHMDLYQAEIVLVRHSKTNIHMFLRLPVPLPQNRFTLLSVHTFPVPIHTHDPTARGYSQITMPYSHLAVNNNGLYMEIKATDLAVCKVRGAAYVCPFYFTVKREAARTCLISLWIQNETRIFEACIFTVFPEKSVPPFMYHIQGDQYAVSFPEQQYNLVCANTTETYNSPCAFCFLTIPCFCQIQTNSVIIPNAIAACNNGTQAEITVQRYSVNLPFAYAFNLSTFNVGMDFTHTYPILLQLPNISDIIKDVHTFTAQDLENGIELKNLASAIALIDKLKLDSDSPIQAISNAFKNPGLIAILYLLVTIAYLVIAFLLYKQYKSKAMLTSMIPVARAHSVNHVLVQQGRPIVFSAQVENTNTTSPDLIFNFKIDDSYLILATLIIVTLVMLIKLLHVLYRKMKYCMMYDSVPLESCQKLYLKLQTLNHTFLLPLLTIHAGFDKVKVLRTPAIAQLTVNKLCGKLQLLWLGEVLIQVNDLPQQYVLPTQISISCMARYYISKYKHAYTYEFLLKSVNNLRQSFPADYTHTYPTHTDTQPQVQNNTTFVHSTRNPPSAPPSFREEKPMQILYHALRSMAEEV